MPPLNFGRIAHQYALDESRFAYKKQVPEGKARAIIKRLECSIFEAKLKTNMEAITYPTFLTRIQMLKVPTA